VTQRGNSEQSANTISSGGIQSVRQRTERRDIICRLPPYVRGVHPRVRNAATTFLREAENMATPTAPNPHQNHLLDALPKGDYDRIAADLELVPMQLGDVLY